MNSDIKDVNNCIVKGSSFWFHCVTVNAEAVVHLHSGDCATRVPSSWWNVQPTQRCPRLAACTDNLAAVQKWVQEIIWFQWCFSTYMFSVALVAIDWFVVFSDKIFSFNLFFYSPIKIVLWFAYIVQIHCDMPPMGTNDTKSLINRGACKILYKKCYSHYFITLSVLLCGFCNGTIRFYAMINLQQNRFSCRFWCVF